jgi:hypothetical protein
VEVWNGLQGGRRPFLNLLPKVVGKEEIMHIALIAQQSGVVRPNRSILVVLSLFCSNDHQIF